MNIDLGEQFQQQVVCDVEAMEHVGLAHHSFELGEVHAIRQGLRVRAYQACAIEVVELLRQKDANLLQGAVLPVELAVSAVPQWRVRTESMGLIDQP